MQPQQALTALTLCRGFKQGTTCLQFVTDTRAQKIAEIAANPNAHICWYFENSREQFRLDGTLQVIDASETDEKLQRVCIHPDSTSCAAVPRFR